MNIAAGVIRLIGSVIIAILALVVFASGKPSMDGEPITSKTIDDVMSEDFANQLSAESAPQQSVTNGWVEQDLTEILVHQQLDYRTQGLAFLGVLEICLIGATAGFSWRRDPRGAAAPAVMTAEPYWPRPNEPFTTEGPGPYSPGSPASRPLP